MTSGASARSSQRMRRLSRSDFDEIYGRVPRLTVEVVLVRPEGVVLTRRAIEPCRGQWHIPGGTVLFGEGLREAVRRVALDELKVDVEVGRLLGCIEYPEMHRAGYRGWPVGLAHEAWLSREQGIVSGWQSDDVGVFRSPPPNTLYEQAEFLRKLDDFP